LSSRFSKRMALFEGTVPTYKTLFECIVPTYKALFKDCTKWRKSATVYEMSTQVRAQISERRWVWSKMAAAQLSTIETQLIETIFIPKFAMRGGWAPKTTPLYLEMGASTIENDISTIERNWSTIDSWWFGIKKRNGGDGVYPSPYLGVGVSTIENSCSTLERNWSESTWFDIKIRKGEGLGKHTFE